MTDSLELWPASAGQEGIWLGAKIAEPSPVYHTAEYIEIIGPLDRARLKRALSHRLSEWPTLRPRFALVPDEISGEDRLMVGESEALEPLLPLIDVSDAPQPRRAALAHIEKLRVQPIVITASAAVRFCLIRLGSHGHILAIISHHITLDGYSYGLLIKQLKADYNAASSESAAVPAALPAAFGGDKPMARLAKERAAYEASADYSADLEFWRQELADFAGHGKAAPDAFTDTIHRVRVPVASKDADQIAAICREFGCHWSLFWLAAGFLLTYRQSGQRDIVLGVPLMPRMGSAALRIPAMTMNIIPVRLKIRPDDSLGAVMARLKPKLSQCSRHGRFRSEQLRRELPGLSPSLRLFAGVVNIMPFDYGAADFAGCQSESQGFASGPVEGSSIIIARRNGVLTVKIELNGARYSADDAKHMAREFRQEWRSLVDAPSLSFREREGYLSVMAAPAIDPMPQDVTAMIRAHGGADHIALVCSEGELSYDQLLHRAQAFADRLSSLGVAAGERVFTCLERSGAAIAALLGCSLLGATFVPLLTASRHSPAGQGPSLGPGGAEAQMARNRHILKVCGPGPVVASTGQLAAFKDAGRELIDLDGWYAQGQRDGWEPASDGQADVHPAGLDAYILFTSGSTGTPKGVRISRGSLAAFAYGGSLAYELSSADRVLQFAPFHFDTLIEELFCTLAAGGALVLRNDELLESPERFIDFVASRGVTVLDLPTAYWHELVSFLAASERSALPHRVRKVIIGGEYAKPDAVRQWRRITHATLYNSYGPTEATVVATVCKVFDDSQADSIGVPLPGRAVAILDDELTPVPIGVKGQIAIAGVLATDYLSAADRERFVDLDLPYAPGYQRVYLTGDYGIMTTAVQFAGRMDDEVKISGTRIHPAEVAAAIRALSGVADAEVLRWQEGDGPVRLAAFVVGTDLTERGLREALRLSVPEVMVPAHIGICEELPVNSQGKIDRKALMNRLANAADPVPFASAEAAAVQGVWAELLGQRRFQPGDDFFAIGGTSLAAIQLANRLSLVFKRPCPVSLVFDRPRLEDQIAAFSCGAGESGAAAGGPLAQGGFAELKARLSEDIHRHSELMAERAERWAAETRAEPEDSAEGTAPWLVLTGATGYVGIYLLAKLLAASTGPVACLVRGGSVQEATQRLMTRWREHFGAEPLAQERLRIILADLDAPDLALSAGDRSRLLRHSATIVHAGAKVRVMQSYEALRPANVAATGALLAMAMAAKARFIYVSTMAVVPLPATTIDAFAECHEGLKDGYQQSKWAGEQVTRQAIGHGLDAKIVRVGRVCPALAQPIINPHDLFWQLARSCIRLSCYPEEPMIEPWLPVDHFAATVAGLATPASPGWQAGAVIDALPSQPTDIAALLGRLYRFGYLLTPMPYREWLVHLATSDDPEDSQLYHILKGRQLVADPSQNTGQPMPTPKGYEALVAALGQDHAAIDDEAFAAMVASAQKAGILPVG